MERRREESGGEGKRGEEEVCDITRLFLFCRVRHFSGNETVVERKSLAKYSTLPLRYRFVLAFTVYKVRARAGGGVTTPCPPPPCHDFLYFSSCCLAAITTTALEHSTSFFVCLVLVLISCIVLYRSALTDFMTPVVASLRVFI